MGVFVFNINSGSIGKFSKLFFQQKKCIKHLTSGSALDSGPRCGPSQANRALCTLIIMKVKYTKQKFDVENETYLEKEGPFESDLASLLFVEMPKDCRTDGWFGVLPPHKVLIEILEFGQYVNGNNVLFEWSPFDLTEVHFEELQAAIKANPEWGIEIEFPPDSEEDWSHWALVRALEKKK